MTETKPVLMVRIGLDTIDFSQPGYPPGWMQRRYLPVSNPLKTS